MWSDTSFHRNTPLARTCQQWWYLVLLWILGCFRLSRIFNLCCNGCINKYNCEYKINIYRGYVQSVCKKKMIPFRPRIRDLQTMWNNPAEISRQYRVTQTSVMRQIRTFMCRMCICVCVLIRHTTRPITNYDGCLMLTYDVHDLFFRFLFGHKHCISLLTINPRLSYLFISLSASSSSFTTVMRKRVRVCEVDENPTKKPVAEHEPLAVHSSTYHFAPYP